MNCRLLVNIISKGKSYPRDSVVDDELIPERLKNEKYIAYDLEGTGKVLALHDLNFYVVRPSADGVSTSYPAMISGGESVNLEELPESYRDSLKEGVDYREKFTIEEQKALQAQLHDTYLKHFESEPEPEVATHWRSGR